MTFQHHTPHPGDTPQNTQSSTMLHHWSLMDLKKMALPFSCSVAVGKYLYLSEPQILHL